MQSTVVLTATDPWAPAWAPWAIPTPANRDQITPDQDFNGADDVIRTRDPHLGNVKRTLR